MREDDALDNNPLVSMQALEALHEQLYGWSLSRCGYDPSTAEDLMQEAYVELLSGRARFEGKSSSTCRCSSGGCDGRDHGGWAMVGDARSD